MISPLHTAGGTIVTVHCQDFASDALTGHADAKWNALRIIAIQLSDLNVNVDQ
jgi:hypothetical protein